ncbi:uncharacterized protein LOC129000537 [Macrosteles quadrilineatus]|uniref:uncharacterized protein LOC129000537 n=1 Tax=Macrosteles quadrilineatus TaxID=74068 RepID=UPI0023E0B705|nr:uncharacterized protein LOC129000537 [Macrosteles quadrilineatus]
MDEREQNGSQEFEMQGREGWLSDGEGRFRLTNTPPEGQFPLQNGSHIKFEAPRVPVIFVLGGPGSGKVTHCDTLMQEKRGVVHINMTDLLQQYTVGNDMKDFNQLSSKTVTEVLMLEIKMAPAAKAYLVSGYPRNMRDVVEYTNKIQIVSGVILVAWREKVLERQIDYGAKLGHVVLSLARMELSNFYKNVIPVADYYDQRGMLIAINGERHPTEVYTDFRVAVLRFLGSQDKTVVAGVPNGVAHMPDVAPLSMVAPHTTTASVYQPPTKGYPPVVWVIGGPGSNKSTLCSKAVRQAQGWVSLSVGRMLRAAADVQEGPVASDTQEIRKAIVAGDLVTQDPVLQLVETHLNTNMNAQGILIDGFPRDIDQVRYFEDKFKQQPNLILLDCSKLQLGRGRLDDSIAAFRRRLELFREKTLPMLKTMDNENRLSIVDGDTDSPQVQEDFIKLVLQEIERLKKSEGMIVPEPPTQVPNGHLSNHHADHTVIHDLEDVDDGPAPVHMNGYGPAGPPKAISDVASTINNYHQTNMQNGGLFGGPTLGQNGNPPPRRPPSREAIRGMYANVDRYPMDSHI